MMISPTVQLSNEAFILVVIDFQSQVAESNEENNSASAAILIWTRQQVLQLFPEPAFDGYRFSNEQLGSSSRDIQAGNRADPTHFGTDPPEIPIRGFIGFPLATVRPGSQILAGELHLFQARVEGDPYDNNRQLLVDLVNLGAALGPEDFSGDVLTQNIGALSTSPEVEFKMLDVTSAVEDTIEAGRSRVDLRLRFSTELDGDKTPDIAHFESSENFLQTNNRPSLNVSVLLPETPLVPQTEPNDNVSQAQPFLLDSILIGDFGRRGDEDFYSFQALEGDMIEVNVNAESLNPRSPADTVVSLLDGRGIVLLENDDDPRGGTRDSFLRFVVQFRGKYILRLREKAGNGGRTYKYQAELTVSGH
jgi:hypothetical protein